MGQKGRKNGRGDEMSVKNKESGLQGGTRMNYSLNIKVYLDGKL
jgi:hypothetical protein